MQIRNQLHLFPFTASKTRKGLNAWNSFGTETSRNLRLCGFLDVNKTTKVVKNERENQLEEKKVYHCVVAFITWKSGRSHILMILFILLNDIV